MEICYNAFFTSPKKWKLPIGADFFACPKLKDKRFEHRQAQLPFHHSESHETLRHPRTLSCALRSGLQNMKFLYEIGLRLNEADGVSKGLQ